MARPRQFDETAVLDAAAREFRVHGFADTSTAQLCEAAGLGRSSLYNTFTSKDELFVRALDRFTTETTRLQAEILSTPGTTALERLRTLLDTILDEEAVAAAAGHAAGCMTVASLMAPDLRAHDPRVAAILDADLRRRLDQLEDTVRLGQAEGSVTTDLTPSDAAWLVVTTISGVRVSAQAGATVETLRRVALGSLRSLAA